MTLEARLPFRRADALQSPPDLRRLQARGPIHRVRTAVGDEAWLVTEYDEVRRLLDDHRLGRAHPDPETAARTGESALFGGPIGDFATEHADHARMRSLLQPHFSPRRMRALRPRVEALTSGLLDALAQRGSPADLHTELAVPLPILVICELLGVPYADRDRFRAWSEDAGNTRDRTRSERGLGELYAYGLRLVAAKRQAPGDDVISRLCATDDLADPVTDEEAAELSMGVLFAGHETTVVRIGLGAMALLANRDQWQALVADPGLVPAAVEEILRAPGSGDGGMPRYARTDLDVGGVTIRTGELVLLDISAANHDPAAFADPERVDVTRTGSGNAAHLTFGHGARYCLGAPLARIELDVVFTQLVRRFPDLQLATDLGEVPLRHDTLTGGPAELRVRW